MLDVNLGTYMSGLNGLVRHTKEQKPATLAAAV